MRYLIANAAHAARVFAGAERADVRGLVCDSLEDAAGAIVIEVDETGAPVVITRRLANGAEIARALASVDGAVAFLLAGLPPPVLPESGPPSRDPALAAVEVENARLRKVKTAARALLAALPKCSACNRPTLDREGPAGEDWPCCPEHHRCSWSVDEDEQAIRALEAALGADPCSSQRVENRQDRDGLAG